MLILASTVTDCASISAFVLLVCVPVGIMSSAVGLKICEITAGIKKVLVSYQENEEEVW